MISTLSQNRNYHSRVIFSLNFIPRSRNKFRSKNNLPTVLEWKIIETSSQIHFRRSKSKSKVRSLIVHTVFTQSVNCHACYVSNRWKPRRYPRRTPTPPSKSLSAIRGTCKRRGGGMIFYRVFNNSWYARAGKAGRGVGLLGQKGIEEDTREPMVHRLIIRRIEGSPNDPWLKSTATRLLWKNLMKQVSRNSFFFFFIDYLFSRFRLENFYRSFFNAYFIIRLIFIWKILIKNIDRKYYCFGKGDDIFHCILKNRN